MLRRLTFGLGLAFAVACDSSPSAQPAPAPLIPANRDSMSERLELMVGDVQKSVTFYTGTVGFELVSAETDYAVVRAGKVSLGLNAASSLSSSHYFNPELGTQRRGLGVEIVLEVDDVQNYYAAVTSQNATISSPLTKRSWGATDFRLADPDGYYLRITSRN